MKKPLNFQEIFMTLQDFWAKEGCLIWQPYYSQIGAGTMNPGTFLRVLGPEPWKVAYVEPSIRPDDGRYGENPNRMQMHYQFQVILKPDPGNPQEIYLRSLEALGVDPRQHDIRFVEDNWEQPALGAWGLGWEVWLDGQEITQFTYFQQAGGITLDPVSVEITYGLDRIAIALQGVSSFRDIQWSPALTDGDVNLQGEQEHSKYYFEIANVERLQQLYSLYEAEAMACLDQGLVLPAHDYVLRCSHTFNVLDTRGAISITERQAIFGRMREMAHRVSQTYLEQRQRLEFPFIKVDGAHEQSVSDHQALKPKVPHAAPANGPAPFLLEIGTEELPVAELDSSTEQLRRRVPALLEELRLAHGEVSVSGTPRRLVVLVENLAPMQSDLEQVIKGPPASRAFGPGGEPTKAAEGFARGKGVNVSDLQVREMDGGQYVTAVVREKGRPAAEVLSETLSGLAASLRFEKTMRWNWTNVAFSRPVRWLLALYGETVIPFEFAGVQAGNTTRGLRFDTPNALTVSNPGEYFRLLGEQGILLDAGVRKDTILAQVQALAAGLNGEIAPDEALLSEVANLVEAPHALVGSFDRDYLRLPREVLISVMKKHQRYFPLQDTSGNLLPYFITVRNGNHEGMDLVRDGNEQVVRARFADAAYFVREDVRRPLSAYLEKLGTLTFHKKLGSMLDKSRRVAGLLDDLADALALSAAEQQTARRAAELSKADLATQMVVEMTSLQGVMGRYYALNSGESQTVADAIFEHYLPRFSGDSAPQTKAGLAVGIADRLDTLVGLFAAGMAPSGNKDPFALRRAALGLVLNLTAWNLDFDLRQAVRLAAGRQPVEVSADQQAAVLAFIVERSRVLLLEQGYRHDVVDAVLAEQGYDPVSALRNVQALKEWVARPDWNTILPAYARCVRITRDLEEQYGIDPARFIEPVEGELFSGVEGAEAALCAGSDAHSVDAFLNAFLPLIPTVNRYFTEVLVMAEDPVIRQNRLGLLQRTANLAVGRADLSKLDGF